MKRTHLIVTLIAAGHVALIACSAFQLSQPTSALGLPLRWYGAMTGADGNYGFFAPGVSSQLRASFTMADRRGRTWTDALADDSNREVELRLGSMFGMTSEPELGQAITAAWAAQMFGRHPNAQFVTIRIEAYELPTMDEYRAGKQPEWQLVEEMTFSREALLAKAKEPQR